MRKKEEEDYANVSKQLRPYLETEREGDVKKETGRQKLSEGTNSTTQGEINEKASGEKKSELGFAGFPWSEGREKKDAKAEGGMEGGIHEGMERDELTHREGGNGVLIFSASAFGSAEPPRSQLLSDWPGLQRAVD